MIWISIEPHHIDSILIDMSNGKYEVDSMEFIKEIQDWFSNKHIIFETKYDSENSIWKVGFTNKGDAMLFKLEWY